MPRCVPMPLRGVASADAGVHPVQRTYREIMYLSSELREHPNIVKLVNILRAENDTDIYLVFEHLGEQPSACCAGAIAPTAASPLAETDLHAVIRAGILQPIHKQFVVYQLVKALRYMHSAELLHRDVKPSNLLLNADCSVKLCDFGLCRSTADMGSSSDAVLTDYVATRWYRAPEILLGSTEYGKGVDMWSVGCILGEMLNGKPVFPGNSTMNQLDRILALTGRPTSDDIAAVKCVLRCAARGRENWHPRHCIPAAGLPLLPPCWSLCRLRPRKPLRLCSRRPLLMAWTSWRGAWRSTPPHA